jgi:hypothetical protein
MTALFGPQTSNAALSIPSGNKVQRYGSAQTWFQDCTGPGASNGTVPDAAFYNRIIGALDYLVGVAGITVLPGDDSALYRAVVQILTAGLELAAVAYSGAYSDLSGRPTLATVAASGSYTDLINTPTMVQNVTATGSISVNHSTGEFVRMSLTGNVAAFAVTSWPAAGTLGRLALEISNTGAFGISAWPAGTTWAGGVAPVITSGAGKVDIVILTTFDGGTTIRGSVVGQNYS